MYIYYNFSRKKRKKVDTFKGVQALCVFQLQTQARRINVQMDKKNDKQKITLVVRHPLPSKPPSRHDRSTKSAAMRFTQPVHSHVTWNESLPPLQPILIKS